MMALSCYSVAPKRAPTPTCGPTVDRLRAVVVTPNSCKAPVRVEFCVSPAALPCVFMLFKICGSTCCFFRHDRGFRVVLRSSSACSPERTYVHDDEELNRYQAPSPHMLSGLFATPMNYRRAPAKASSSISCGPPYQATTVSRYSRHMIHIFIVSSSDC